MAGFVQKNSFTILSSLAADGGILIVMVTIVIVQGYSF